MPSYPCLNQVPLRPAPRLIGVAMLLVGLALVTTSPAHAEVYKWIDEDGVTHYSSAPPAKAKAAFKRLDRETLAIPQAKVPKQAAPDQQAVKDLNSKVDSLERQVDAERQARQAAEAQTQATQAAFAQAVADQQAAHSVSYIPTIPSVSGVLLLPSPQRNHVDHCRSAGPGKLTTCPQSEIWPRPSRDKTH